MSEDLFQDPDQVNLTQEELDAQEKASLLERAKQMNLKVSNNISLKTLREKVNNAIEGIPPEPTPEEEVEAEMGVARLNMTRSELNKKARRLIRLRYTNMNPAKAKIPGEVIVVANGVIGTIRQVVPFGEAAQAGFHVPYAIYQYMKKKKFPMHQKGKDGRDDSYSGSRWVNEYNIEVLPPLTKEQIAKIARKQMAEGFHDNEDGGNG